MNDHDLLIRIDERVGHLIKQMDNHLQHHADLENNLEERLDKLASRSLLTPIKNLFKWIIKIR